MRTGTASRTAVLTCQGRAVAAASAGFEDPTALPLLREDERVVVRQVLAGAVPSSFGSRLEYEQVRACGEVMLPRTLAVDEAVRTRTGERPGAAQQVVVLGAGLDGRAWRMPELAGCSVFEVDHPDSQRDKQDRVRAAGLAPITEVRFVPVDLTRERLDAALATADHDPAAPTVWIWEGVIAYLRREEVRAAAAAVAALSAPGSRLVANYEAPSTVARLGLALAFTLTTLAGRRPVTAGEPRRSAWTPAAIGALVGGLGLTVADDRDLGTVAEDLDLRLRTGRYLSTSRVLVADRH
jgi:methyltransferase (TIGR00027 family)